MDYYHYHLILYSSYYFSRHGKFFARRVLQCLMEPHKYIIIGIDTALKWENPSFSTKRGELLTKSGTDRRAGILEPLEVVNLNSKSLKARSQNLNDWIRPLARPNC